MREFANCRLSMMEFIDAPTTQTIATIVTTVMIVMAV